MWENTLEDAIAAIQYGWYDKQHLLNFNASLKMREKTFMDVIAVMNVGGDIFIPTPMIEPLEKEVYYKYVTIKEIMKKIL